MGNDSNTVFHSDDHGVRVTGSKVQVGADTFVFDSITSVRVRLDRMPTSLRIALFGAGALFVLVGMAGFEALAVLGSVVIAAGCFCMAFWHQTYAVVVTTPARATTVLKSKDEGYAQTVAKAIGEAMVGRA